jgi:hypothetical protein
MPTYEWTATFARELAKLSAPDRAAFREAVALFVAGLRDRNSFRPELRIHKLKDREAWSLTFGPDLRAVFAYGDEIENGHPHIVWHHIGAHAIYKKR